jgi:hypothetical protein
VCGCARCEGFEKTVINETGHSYPRAVPYVWMDAVRQWEGSKESV